jgi:hypothetical protein
VTFSRRKQRLSEVALHHSSSLTIVTPPRSVDDALGSNDKERANERTT